MTEAISDIEDHRHRRGRKTNQEREQIRAAQTVEQRRAEREAKRARRFYADTPLVLGILLALIAMQAVSTFSVSFSGLYAAAAWAVGPIPWLQVAVPFMLDMAIVAFTLALFVERERGHSVKGTWAAIAVFAVVSAVANILHTLTVSTAKTLPELIVGAVISGGAPLLLAFATDKIAVKVFAGHNEEERA